MFLIKVHLQQDWSFQSARLLQQVPEQDGKTAKRCKVTKKKTCN